MRFFRSSKITLGLDIGSHSVKAVQLLRESSSEIRLISLGLAEIDQNLKGPADGVLSAIKSAIKDFDLKKTPLITSLSGSSLVIKQVTFPTSSPKEIESSLKWEASRHIPIPLDRVELIYQIRKINKEEKNAEVLLAAVDKELLQNHLNLLNQIFLQPIIIDANPLALANAFLTLNPDNEDKNIAIIEIGASATTVTIFRKGDFFFTRDIPFGGNRFTREVQEIYHLDYPQAELFKKQENLDPNLMKPAFNNLLLEIRQSLLFYDTRTGNKGYEEIVFTGGGAKLRGLSSYLEENLNLPMVAFEPFENVKIDDNVLPDVLGKGKPQLGVAMGLALRG